MTQNTKYQSIIQTGRELFWKHGIKKVTVEEICEQTPVSKMTFYKHFDNKIELAKTIMKDLFDDGIRQYRDIIDSDISYEEKVKKIIQMKMDNTYDLSREFLNDIYRGDVKELHEIMQQYVQRNLKMVTDDFRLAQKQGYIRKDLNIDFVLYMMNKVIEMSTDETLNNMYNNPQEMVNDFTKFFFYGILSQQVKHEK